MSNNKSSYSAASDDILAGLAKNGDNFAYNELAMRYAGVIGSIARKYSVRTYDRTDFIQEGLMGLLYACKTYDKSGGASFKSFLRLVVERRYISIIRRFGSQKTIPDSALVDISDAEFQMGIAESPEGILEMNERLNSIVARLKEVLSKTEFETVLLFSEGFSYNDIAAQLNISQKSVDNALQRARKKVGKINMSQAE